jgi:hypothetical protein
MPLSVLVSYYYLASADRSVMNLIRPERLLLDSGAFSAFQKGKAIDIDALIEEVANPRWSEAVGLDVIGDPIGSRANLDYMRAKGGTKAMPVFHIGEPFELLDYYCEHWPKVGLSCRFGESVPQSIAFYATCFARRWPHKFHSFGWVSESVLMKFPFHSADSSTWVAGIFTWAQTPASSRSLKTRALPGTGRPTKAALTASSKTFLAATWAVQENLRARWRREMNLLEAKVMP